MSGPLPRHDPTPEQIQAACEQIRAEWSAAEEISRNQRPAQPWEVPTPSSIVREPVGVSD